MNLFCSFVWLAATLHCAAAATITTCNANDCLRQVRATNFPTRSTTADCSSFVGTTTVAKATTTSTVTVTTTPVAKRAVADANFLERRAGTIPTYASSCRSAAAYSSACSCIGITQGTVTAQTTSTVTVTSTTTAAAVPAVTTFALKVNYPATAPDARIFVGLTQGSGYSYDLSITSDPGGVEGFIYTTDDSDPPPNGARSVMVLGASYLMADGYNGYAKLFSYIFDSGVALYCRTGAAQLFSCNFPTKADGAGVFFVCKSGTNAGRVYVSQNAQTNTFDGCDSTVMVTLTAFPYVHA